MYSSSLSDLKKSTAVDESLSKTWTDVLFQRISTNFNICRDVVIPDGTGSLISVV